MKEYLFNPFMIKEISNNNLKTMYQDTYDKLIQEPNSMYDYAHNIEIYSNLMYICGECIARFTREILELKTTIQIDTAKCMARERNKYIENKEKAPAMSYFEAIATENSKDDISKLADQECFLKRFKNAYETLDVKCNALKKKMEAVKFEEFNG